MPPKITIILQSITQSFQEEKKSTQTLEYSNPPLCVADLLSEDI